MNNKKLFPALLLTGAAFLAATAMAQAQRTISKQVTQEVPSPKGSLIRVATATRKVTFKTWDQPKVKITMDISFDTAHPRKPGSDAEWFEELGISVKPFSNRVDILSKSVNLALSTTRSYGPAKKEVVVMGYNGSDPRRKHEIPSGVAGKNQEVVVQGYRGPAVHELNILIPAGCKLDVENKYGDVVIGMNVDEAKLEITNGALDAQDIKDLKLTGNYCNANLGNIDKAEIEFNNGTFRAQNINDLDMDSKSSTIDYEKGKYLYMRSQADNYTIESIDKIDGRKVYGSIKIDQLNNSFDLEGNNVDIKFRTIMPEVSLIKVTNKYGDIRMPVKSLQNYAVDFIGNYSTVFAPFKKEVVKDEEVKEEKKEGETETVNKTKVKDVYVSGYANQVRAGTASLGELAPRHFTSAVGDTKGKHTRIELTCHSCTVDFK